MLPFVRQFQAVVGNCLLLGLRNRQYLSQSILVVIMMVFIVVQQNFDRNNLLTPLYMSIAVVGFSRSVISLWVNQKQTHQKELQRIMGLSESSYILGWLVYFILNSLFITLIMSVLLSLSFFKIIDGSIIAEGYSLIKMIILIELYCLTSISWSLLIANFFNKAKTAAQISTFLQILLSMLLFLVLVQQIQQNKIYMFLLSIFPPIAFQFGICSFYFPKRFLFKDFKYNYSDGVLFLLVEGIVYLILALYLDQVLRNQNGHSKHPLFFIRWLWKKQNLNQSSYETPFIEQRQKVHQTSAKYQEKIDHSKQPLITMNNVVKNFQNLSAVNDVSIKFYESQIFCLLGHNGAGKSTLINLLTGILQPSEGKIELFGMNYWDQPQKIRQNIGLCLQYNVLYDNLTVQDHLSYYYKLKCSDMLLMPYRIQEIIQKCALSTQRGKRSKNLSGGNKRKLCLANAIIGGSSLLFLDEPSSGLDPSSRRSIWNVIQSLRNQNKCILLTTHHLEEAEKLAKRIGIMSEGKLVIVGSSKFIKEKFNIGYHLTIALKNQNYQKKCRNIIQSLIPNAQQDHQTAAKTIKYILPKESQKKFTKMFFQLQKQNIGQLSLAISTLEDAFIKLGTSQAQQSGNTPQIPQINLPNIECKYSFKKQFQAIFYKKYLTNLRSLSVIVSFALPLFFILAGVMISVVAFNTKYDFFQKIFVMNLFMIFAFIFTTSFYTGSLVQQRQMKFKYLSNVMGLHQLPYWIASYTFDFLIFLFPISIFFIVIYIIGEKAQFLTKVTMYLVPLFILFGFTLISYSYVFSFIFQKSLRAYGLMPFINFTIFYALPTIIQILVKNQFIKSYLMPLLSPFTAFSRIFFTQQFLGFYNQNYWFSYLALTIQGIVSLALVLLLQNLRFSLKQDKQNIQQQPQSQNLNTIQYNQKKDGQIVIDKLWKKYPNGFVSIRNTSFTVQKGEIFGLLGPNGAGKSTTFNIATGSLSKTSGSVKIFGDQVNKGIRSIFENVGVCPQYDSLYPNLTTEEHLKYFSLLKGLNKLETQKILQFYGEVMSLSNYMKVKAGKLSGGNKRKLCVSIAMLANPAVAFFDQPSTGMDPYSRRYLWKSLTLAVKQNNSSMVLTTHYMGEAESLCSQIGILIKGKFICLNSPQKLKQLYGTGYRVSILAPVNNQKSVIRKIKQKYGANIVIQKSQKDQEQLLVTFRNKQFCLSEAYYLFYDQMKAKEEIDKFQIHQSTLEQIFLYFSKMQPEYQEQVFKQPWKFLCCQCGINGCECMI